MKNKIITFLISLFLIFSAGLASAKTAFASPRLILDPVSTTINKDASFEVKINIDVESQSAFGADAAISYPASDMDFKSVSNGGFFPDFSSATSAGRIEIHAFFSNAFDSKSGSGTFATLSFTARKDSGTSVISFICTGTGSDTQILDINGNNILSCSSLNQSSISYLGTQNTGGTNTNATPTPTPSPSPTPTAKPKKLATSPSPQVVTLSKYKSPSPSASPTPTSTPVPAKTSLLDNKLVTWGLGLVGIVIFLGIIIWLVRKFVKGEENPPQINPPSGPTISHNVEPPVQNPY